MKGNDQCASCNILTSKYVTPEAYGKYVDAAIQRIQKEVPKVVVNLRKILFCYTETWALTYVYLVGSFKVSGVFPLTAGQTKYCKPNGILENKIECSCSGSADKLASMDAVSDGKNNNQID